MNEDPVEKRLRESAWRRELTGAEQAELQAWLEAHPEAKAEWEGEARLNALLERLPDAPVASNFTARVMQAVQREAAQPRSTPNRWNWLGRVFVPRLAVATVVVCVGLVTYHRREVAHRKSLAKTLVAVAQIGSSPDATILIDFDAINRLSQSPPPDEELLALLQ